MQTSVLRCYARAARRRARPRVGLRPAPDRPAPGPTQRPPPPPPPSAAEAETVPTSGKRASVMGSGEWEGGMAARRAGGRRRRCGGAPRLGVGGSGGGLCRGISLHFREPPPPLPPPPHRYPTHPTRRRRLNVSECLAVRHIQFS